MAYATTTDQLRDLKEQFAKSEKLFNELARFTGSRYIN